MKTFKERIVVFDLEATCQDRKIDANFPHQIIEIGAVDNHGCKFSSFVKPTDAPILTDFCKGLTTIKQSDVDNADTFEEVNKEFFDFYNGATLISWGAYDKNQMIKEISKTSDKVGLDYIKSDHVNLKEFYREVTGRKARGMRSALTYLGLTLKGTHHRGIDDAINIMEIYKELVRIKG